MTAAFFGSVCQKHVTVLPDSLTRALAFAQEMATKTKAIVYIRQSVVHGLLVTHRIDLSNHASTIGAVTPDGMAVWMAREIELLGAVFEPIHVQQKVSDQCA